MRWIITELKPIQVSNVNLNEYIELRKEFTSEEWLDLLMHSIGLDPASFNKRDKFIQLSRLIPHVENNYNFIELGPLHWTNLNKRKEANVPTVIW